MRGERGVSSVVATVLLVAVVLVITVTAGNYALQFTDETRDPAPQVHATMDPVSTTDGNLTIRKNGGEEVPLSELEIQIRNADNGSTVRLVDLPASGGINSSNVEGIESMVAPGSGSGPLASSDAAVEWSAGDELGLKLPNATAGDRITVRIIHVESDSIVWTDSQTVQ